MINSTILEDRNRAVTIPFRPNDNVTWNEASGEPKTQARDCQDFIVRQIFLRLDLFRETIDDKIISNKGQRNQNHC